MNANIAHDHGFFVGNHPRDLTAEITRLRDVLDAGVQRDVRSINAENLGRASGSFNRN